MRLKAFRIQMYRPILDSGWVDVDNVTVVVGKNESGKTALLRALHKFNPFTPEPYVMEREWPRGHRNTQSMKTEVVAVRFQFEETEIAAIASFIPSHIADTLEGVEITKTYDGNYKYHLLPNDNIVMDASRVFCNIFVESLHNVAISERLRTALNGLHPAVVGIAEHREASRLEHYWLANLERLQSGIDPESDQDILTFGQLMDAFETLRSNIDTSQQRISLEDLIQTWIPVFVYMDDHKPFRGSAYLNEIRDRIDEGRVTDEDKTFLMMLEMAGLDFHEELNRAETADREQRMLDMDDASSTFTALLADHWTQRKYQVRLRADGFHILVFVNDNIQTALVPLDERSKGFQWFFSFDATLLHETKGTFKGAIILLDEPGLHLHASAQRDLLNRLKEYAKNNQVIYSTHMPFMIDMERLDNIRICIERDDQGTTVSNDYYSSDVQARFPLQAALGLSFSQSLFVGQYNLVVEGVTDLWIISAMAALLRVENMPSLDERIIITPSGGASKVTYVATMLLGQELNVVVLLDSDTAGKLAAEELIKNWIAKDRQVVLLDAALGLREGATIEDLFPDDFYLHYVNQAYQTDFGENILTIDEIGLEGGIVHRIEIAMVKRGLPSNSQGRAFNKGRVIKAMLVELPRLEVSELPKDVVDRFAVLFQKIQRAMSAL